MFSHHSFKATICFTNCFATLIKEPHKCCNVSNWVPVLVPRLEISSIITIHINSSICLIKQVLFAKIYSRPKVIIYYNFRNVLVGFCGFSSLSIDYVSCGWKRMKYSTKSSFWSHSELLVLIFGISLQEKRKWNKQSTSTMVVGNEFSISRCTATGG